MTASSLSQLTRCVLGGAAAASLALLFPLSASAQDIILENFDDFNPYSETWNAEWSNVAVADAYFNPGTSPTLESRGFGFRSTANGPTTTFLISPVSNSNKATSWVLDGNGGFAVRFGSDGINPASNSNAAQRHHGVSLNLAKTGNQGSSATALPVYRYTSNLIANNQRYLRLTAWRDTTPNNNPAPANTAKFIVGMQSTPSSNCAIPDSSLGPWDETGTTLIGWNLTTTRQVFVIDLWNETLFKADEVQRLNLRFGNLFRPCSPVNVSSALRANPTSVFSFLFGYYRTGIDAGTETTKTLSPIRFYLDDIILMGRLPGFDTTPSLTLIPEVGPDSSTSFSVVLAAIPSHPVTLNLANSNSGAASLSTTTLVFTPDNWDVPQFVELDAVDDGLPNHEIRETTISFTKGSTLDLLYADDTQVPVPAPIVFSIENLADAGVTVTTSSLTVTESVGPNQSTNFSVVLDSIPTAPMTLNITSSDTNAITVSQSSLVFDSTNWNVPQVVTVTGVDDDILAGPNRSAAVEFAISTACPFYSALVDPADLEFTIINDGLPVAISHMSAE
jgi:hypothetical protein